MLAFWWEPVGMEVRPSGEGRDLGQWGGPPGPPPLHLHQLPDMSHQELPFFWSEAMMPSRGQRDTNLTQIIAEEWQKIDSGQSRRGYAEST